MNNTNPEILDTVSKKIEELKQLAKKYPLIEIDIEDLENQVHFELNKQLKIPLTPKDKVYVPVRKQHKIGLVTEKEKEKKQIEEGLLNKNVVDLQIKKFKNEFKRWLQNLIITLNQFKKQKKDLDIKKIILPFIKLEVRKASKKFAKQKILVRVMAKLYH